MIQGTRNVRKRDGREVPFDQAKIADAIYRAARSVGGADQFLSEELASVVSMFIEKEWGERLPSIDDISDLIEKVLVETGHASTAKAYILERDRRARIRSALRVRRDEDGASDSLPSVDARTHATVSSWSKGKIVEALVVEADLAPGVAEEIAAEVERRVFASGLTRVSTMLLRALVDNELFERGYERVLNRQATIGLPRYDLDRMVRGGLADGDAGVVAAHAGCAEANDRVVAQASWTQYSLLAVHPPEVTEAHLAGRVHVGGLGSPSRVQRLEVDVPAEVRVADAAVALDELRLFVARARELVEEELTLRGWERAAFVLDSDDPAATAMRVLTTLSAPADVPEPRPRVAMCVRQLDDGLSPKSSAHEAFVAELLRAAPRLDAAGRLRPPRIYVDLPAGAPGGDDLDVLEALVLAEAVPGRAGLRVETGALLGRTTGLAAFSPTFLRVDVDLAQVAFRVRRFETDAVLEQLGKEIEVAGAACEARARFFDGLPSESSPRARLQRLGGGRDAVGVRYEIGLAGLDAACRIAFDHAPTKDDRALGFARAIVKGARERVAEEAKRRRLPIAAAFTDDPEVLARFGAIDFERHPRGRDVHAIPHDGRRYLYEPTLTFFDGEPSPEESARLEAALRRGFVTTPLPSYHADVADRLRFIREYVGQ